MSSTSRMRSPEAAARGTIANIMTAMVTDMRMSAM